MRPGAAPGPGIGPDAARARPVVGARALRAQAGAEIRLTLRRGDSVLLAIGIPVGLLVFFSLVDVLPLPGGVHHPVQFLAPGILSLAVMSTAMVSLGIATGFERQYGVLKRLGATPLGRPASSPPRRWRSSPSRSSRSPSSSSWPSPSGGA